VEASAYARLTIVAKSATLPCGQSDLYCARAKSSQLAAVVQLERKSLIHIPMAVVTP